MIYLRTMVFAAVLAAAGCGSDSSDPAGSAGAGGGAPAAPSITGTVTYQGAAQGKLVVALFKQWPSNGAPESFVTITAPAFPQDYELKDVNPGDYYVFAFIDIDPPSPTMPGSEDLKSVPTEKTTVTDKGAHADVTIPAN